MHAKYAEYYEWSVDTYVGSAMMTIKTTSCARQNQQSKIWGKITFVRLITSGASDTREPCRVELPRSDKISCVVAGGIGLGLQLMKYVMSLRSRAGWVGCRRR